MDPKIKHIIELINSKKKPQSSLPWKRQEPYSQPYYSFNPTTNSWQDITPSPSPPTTPTITTFTLLSWNIDFMLSFPAERMTAAFAHLYNLSTSLSFPPIIFLQEMTDEDLLHIQSLPWVRTNYHLTDTNPQHWESGHYGTCTLVPRSLPITAVFRVHYAATRMERDALFVDIELPSNGSLRLCNTHLESLVADPPLRPAQLTTAARFMHAPEVSGAVLAGDLNAIQPFDRDIAGENGLRDAYLEMGGKEDSDDGYTWGQMAQVKQREMFGCSRMDKVLVCGGVEVLGFERFGLGVEVVEDEVKKALVEEEGLDGGWVTDHLGVRADFKVVERERTEAKI